METSIQTELGAFRITARNGAIVRLTWGLGRDEESPLLREARRQLKAYSEGRLRDFDLPLAPEGTAFHQSVWSEMRAIPYGKTRTYGDLARTLNGIARAVGTACGANPIPIFIPCHRVVASGEDLGGFSGGQGRLTKRRLLVHEGSIAEQLSFL